MNMKQIEEQTLDSNHSELPHLDKSNKTLTSSVLKEVIIYAIIFIVCVFVLPKYVVQKTIVDGDSMESTLQDTDRLLIDKLTYHIKNPERFDIIVFYPYGKEVDEYYVKRVIALPGETVQIIGQDIYINNELLEENYGKDPITYSGIAEVPITLEDDEFFLLGDNREISLDSRYEEVGLVHKEMIAGHAVLRVWPLNHFGVVK